MSDDLVMARGHTIMGTVDAIGRLTEALHRDPSNARYRELAQCCPQQAMMLGFIQIMEGISAHLDGELSVADLIEAGVEQSKDRMTREVAAYLDMHERGMSPDDPFEPFCR